MVALAESEEVRRDRFNFDVLKYRKHFVGNTHKIFSISIFLCTWSNYIRQ
jgi:hypothetical protein